jgi:hypothetical protein
MDFSQVDARQSTFNHAGRDQTTIHSRDIHYHIHLSPFSLRRRSPRIAINIADDKRPRPTSCPDSLSKGSRLNRYPSEVVLDIDTTTGLINQITSSLLDGRHSPNNHQDLALELESLHQTLTLTKLTIQKYDDTPLGRSLASMISPEVKLCFATLQKLLDSIDGNWLDLNITSVVGLWRRIWCGEWDENELTSLREKMSYGRQSLQELLVTMHSYVSLFLHSLK